jgi:hypothetical protein
VTYLYQEQLKAASFKDALDYTSASGAASTVRGSVERDDEEGDSDDNSGLHQQQQQEPSSLVGNRVEAVESNSEKSITTVALLPDTVISCDALVVLETSSRDPEEDEQEQQQEQRLQSDAWNDGDREAAAALRIGLGSSSSSSRHRGGETVSTAATAATTTSSPLGYRVTPTPLRPCTAPSAAIFSAGVDAMPVNKAHSTSTDMASGPVIWTASAVGDHSSVHADHSDNDKDGSSGSVSPDFRRRNTVHPASSGGGTGLAGAHAAVPGSPRSLGGPDTPAVAAVLAAHKQSSLLFVHNHMYCCSMGPDELPGLAAWKLVRFSFHHV